MYLEKDSRQQGMPELLTIQKKPNQSARNKHKTEEIWPKPEQTRNNPTQVQPQTNRDTTARTDGANKPIVVDNDKQRAYKKTTEISKNLINEMMNKITVKTLAEDNYPISNETVQKLLINLQEQIKALKIELGKYQNSLLLNSTNQHLKKEKEAVEKKLNQIQTIKDLYNQKFQNRNKISQLEAKIIELKNENKQLKIKIARGIQKIESHIHNLPCEREKELIEEVNKYKQSLQREKEMRQNLELNIQNINLNFKRFYLQADQARKIVNLQLKEISKKEQQIKNMEEKLKYQKSDNKSTKGDNFLANSDAYPRKVTNKMSQEENIAEIINKINLSELDNLNRNRSNSIKVPGSIIMGRPKNNEVSGGLGATSMGFNETKSKFNLQDQIEKMRMNQSQFVKLNKRK